MTRRSEFFSIAVIRFYTCSEAVISQGVQIFSLTGRYAAIAVTGVA